MNYHYPLPRPALPEAGRGWISRYAWGDDYHDLMRQRLEALLKKIEEIFPEPVKGKAFVDSGPVLERDVASVSGIGWIGKNTHLISPQLGSWFFLGELFVSVDLIYDRPIRDRCGQCDLCLKACPTGAFAGPYQLDARRCISYLTIELKGAIPRHLRSLIGNHVFGCDICQEVCPYNVKARATTEEAFSPREGLYMPELVSFLSLGDEEFQARFRGSPVLRAKRRGFLRNVAVALGNLKDRSALPHLTQALQDYEPLVREHVAWALGELGGSEALKVLEARLKVEMNPGVIEEIRFALSTEREAGRPELRL
jgi:epoxyqueuosine reductase